MRHLSDYDVFHAVARYIWSHLCSHHRTVVVVYGLTTLCYVLLFCAAMQHNKQQ